MGVHNQLSFPVTPFKHLNMNCTFRSPHVLLIPAHNSCVSPAAGASTHPPHPGFPVGAPAPTAPALSARTPLTGHSPGPRCQTGTCARAGTPPPGPGSLGFRRVPWEGKSEGVGKRGLRPKPGPPRGTPRAPLTCGSGPLALPWRPGPGLRSSPPCCCLGRSYLWMGGAEGEEGGTGLQLPRDPSPPLPPPAPVLPSPSNSLSFRSRCTMRCWCR